MKVRTGRVPLTTVTFTRSFAGCLTYPVHLVSCRS